MTTKPYARALTISTSDSSAATGMQADVKTFASLGCYGMSAVTAVKAQNSKNTLGVVGIAPDLVGQQIEAVLGDIGADAVKIGTLPSRKVVEVVAELLGRYPNPKIVIEPSMIGRDGELLVEPDTRNAVRDLLFPKALCITPNIKEAELLLARTISSRDEMFQAAEDLLKLGPPSVLLTGGRFSSGQCEDVLVTREGTRPLWLSSALIATENLRGAGNTVAAALTALLARGIPLRLSAEKAKEFIAGAVAAGAARKFGSGTGPVQQFFWFWKE